MKIQLIPTSSNRFLLVVSTILALLLPAFLLWPHRSEAVVPSGLRGAILLDVQRHGEAWYVHPADNSKHYLGRPDDAFSIMSGLGLGVTGSDLERIPQVGDSWDGEHELMERVRGRIILDVGKDGEAWYVNPFNGKRYYMGSPADAFGIMQEHSRGATSDVVDSITTEGENVSSDDVHSVQLDIPFVAQAPTGNWSLPYSEACEESLLIMLDHWRKGKTIDPVAVEQEIQALVQWEQQQYGFHQDTSADITAKTAQDYFGYGVRVTEDVTEESIKQELRNGNPILAPVYGKFLYNPHFVGGGPHYHMVMIVGYDEHGFLVHEPGTRHGEAYRYTADVMMNAIHDFVDPEENGAQGRKVIVVVESL